jgi:predicted transcriptional regulator of viral defense system
MKYLEFQREFKRALIIDIREVKNIFSRFSSRRFYEWQKRGLIKKIANNFYIFSDVVLNENHLKFIANKLYSPSYISLETALSYYNLIPEMVYQIKSVTPMKTKKLNTSIGSFTYQKIKRELFWGYILVKINNCNFLMAEPEKAFLDFFYFRKDIKSEKDFYELRINTDSFIKRIKRNVLFGYLEKFNSYSFKKRVTQFLKFIQNA